MTSPTICTHIYWKHYYTAITITRFLTDRYEVGQSISVIMKNESDIFKWNLRNSNWTQVKGFIDVWQSIGTTYDSNMEKIKKTTVFTMRQVVHWLSSPTCLVNLLAPEYSVADFIPMAKSKKAMSTGLLPCLW